VEPRGALHEQLHIRFLEALAKDHPQLFQEVRMIYFDFI
jgi:hypothetical protein